MARERYVNVSIPETLMKKVDKIIKENKDGYTSRAEYIKQSIREKINE